MHMDIHIHYAYAYGYPYPLMHMHNAYAYGYPMDIPRKIHLQTSAIRRNSAHGIRTLKKLSVGIYINIKLHFVRARIRMRAS